MFILIHVHTKEESVDFGQFFVTKLEKPLIKSGKESVNLSFIRNCRMRKKHIQRHLPKYNKTNKVKCNLCLQQRLRSAWASAQSDQTDQSLGSPSEEGLDP